MITKEKPGSPEEIMEHYGVKGMHWGVRKGYSDRQAGIARTEIKVGKGGGTLSEQFKTHAETSWPEAISKGGGLGTKSFNAAALARGNARQAHAERVANGKSTVQDKLAMFGDVRLGDIRVSKNKQNV